MKKVLETILTRYLVAFLNLLLIFINARALGKSGVGVVGVVYASANIAFIFSSILCGNTIIYFMNRYRLKYVFASGYVWAVVGSGIAVGAMALLKIIPDGFELQVFGLSVLMSLVAVNSRVLLGRDFVQLFNITFLLQGGLLFFILIIIYYAAGYRDPSAYVTGLFLTNLAAWIASLLFLTRIGRKKPADNTLTTKPWWTIAAEMFVYGLWSFADNFAEGLTTRLNYFLIQRFGGFAQVGLLDAGTKISESVWHISRSVSSISYSEVARTPDAEQQRRMTLRYFKWTYCALILVMTVVWLLPEKIYTDYLFTPEFQGIRQVVRGLAAGVVALGSNSIISHYFIGTGQVKISALCSFIGLAALCLAGLFLIPASGVFGAAVATSIAFCLMLLFSLTVFVLRTKTRPAELLPRIADFK